MLRIIQSNDMEVLATHLLRRADALREPGLRPERIIVPSLGFGRWLQGRIAARRGVATNVEYQFPAQFVWRLFASVLPAVAADSPFDGEVMRLRLFALLGSLPDDAAHATLHRWLTAHDARGRMDLAAQISRVFQHYLAFRPDWLERWGKGQSCGLKDSDTEHWQLRLWQQLLEAEPAAGPAHPQVEFFRALDRAQQAGRLAQLLPREIRLIGLPAIPPLYLDIVARLSRYTDVSIWFLNPCRDYWVDIVPEKVRAKLAAQEVLDLPSVGHPLLASWGRQTREHLARLMALTELQGVEDASAYVEPNHHDLLGRIKRSILDLKPLRQWLPGAADQSLQIHSCHSLTRQLEVLHDALLHRFAEDSTLRPEDVLVLTPDLDSAAAMIDAVFGAAPPERRLAYAVSGRTQHQSQALTLALQAALALLPSRFEAPAVMTLLKMRPVAERFALADSDFVQLEAWLETSGVRWGLDAEHRRQFDLPATDAHTWADGLQRLLLGFAQPLQGAALSGGVLPVDDIEGSHAEVLGRLLKALAVLSHAMQESRAARPINAWSHWLLVLLDALLKPQPEDLAEDQTLRAAIAGLARDAERANSSEAVPLTVITALLQDSLRSVAPGGVPTGRITFTGLHSLRGLPFRLICIVGLDDGSLPRTPSPLEFDLTLQHPRAGDRNVRDEDRGAFLDALLSAGDALWLSYNGRSQRDNAVLPPSVLVSELLDTLAAAATGGRPAVQAALVTEHALQAFSPRYFDGSLPRSHANELLQAAAIVGGSPLARSQPRLLLPEPLPPAGEEWRTLSLDQLLQFWRHPVRFLLKNRLQLRIRDADAELAGDEPFAIEDTLPLQTKLLELHKAKLAAEQILAVLQADPRLPQGEPGRQLAAGQHASISAMAAQLQALQSAAEMPPLPFSIALGPYTLSGSLTGLSANGLLDYSLLKRGWSNVLPLCIRHVLLNVLQPQGVHATSRLLTPDGLLTLPPLPDAEARLLALLDGYWQGLSTPHGFRPKSAYAYCHGGLDAAEKIWRGNDNKPGENADAWYRLLHGDVTEELPVDFAASANIGYAGLPEKAA